MKPKAYSYLRMSTDLQLKGDSRRRQLEASKAYAEANDLTLADDAQLEDIGVSAFRGANVRDGTLGPVPASGRDGRRWPRVLPFGRVARPAQPGASQVRPRPVPSDRRGRHHHRDPDGRQGSSAGRQRHGRAHDVAGEHEHRPRGSTRRRASGSARPGRTSAPSPGRAGSP